MTVYERIKQMDIKEMALYLSKFELENISREIKFCENLCEHKEECSDINDCFCSDEFIMETYLNMESED